MRTSILYKNINSEVISLQQANQLSYYSKSYYIDAVLKKEETYRNRELKGGIYYLGNNENLEEILHDLGINLSWSICSNKQIINGYTVWESYSYDKDLNPKKKFFKIVSDDKNRLIATVSFSTKTRKSISAFKQFYFGGEQVPYDEKGVFFDQDASLLFLFNDQGEIEKIRMDIMHISDDETWYNLNSFIKEAGSWIDEMMTSSQFEYFTNVEPVVPSF